MYIHIQAHYTRTHPERSTVEDNMVNGPSLQSKLKGFT